MAFVTCGENAEFFGVMNEKNIDLFSEKFNSNESDFQHDVLSLNDNFLVRVELQSKSIAFEKDDHFRNVLTSVSVSDCGRFIAATDLKKYLFLWKRENKEWIAVSCRGLLRKAYKVIFTHKGSEILVSDKGGDVFLFSVIECANDGKLILGHINIILDMVMSKDDRYIITSDRERKIRVSCFPNCYNVFTYCLGHEEFVCALQLVPKDLLVSSSGDGTLKVWQYENGEQLSSFALKEGLANSSTLSSNSKDDKQVMGSKIIKTELPNVVVKTLRYCYEFNLIAALFYDDPSIAIFQISNNTLELIQILPLKAIPIDAYFSSSSILWIILSSKPPTVVSFRCAAKDSVLQFTESAVALTSEINNKLVASKLFEHQVDFTYMFNQCAGFMYESEKCKNEPSAKRNKLA